MCRDMSAQSCRTSGVPLPLVAEKQSMLGHTHMAAVIHKYKQASCLCIPPTATVGQKSGNFALRHVP